MRNLFILLAAVVLTVNVCANQTLPRTYCGCTLGQTVYKDVIAKDTLLPESVGVPWGLAITKDVCVYVGDFVVEDHHFSILTMNFYKDTLYKMEFRDEEINNDIMALNRTFIKKYKEKYSSFEKWLSGENKDEDFFVTCSKTDSILGVSIIGSKHSLQLTLSFVRLADEELKAEFASIFSSAKFGPNYDEKNKVTSIAGVRFGETRQNTINAFKQRGTFLKNEDKITYFSNISFGGSLFSTAIFYFQDDSRRYDKVLTAAKFEKNFYEWRKEEALMIYDAVVSRFKEKYTNCIVLKDEPDHKTMVCGMIDDNYADGKMPPIIVSFELGISRGGDKFYYVTVSYFEMRMTNAAADDI